MTTARPSRPWAAGGRRRRSSSRRGAPPGAPAATSPTAGGRASAALFVPGGGARGRLGVIFLHGWGAVPPSYYRPWIDHPVARGHVVIFPRYQGSTVGPPPQALPSAVLGIRSALVRAPG